MSMLILRRGALEELRRGLNRGFLTSHSFEVTANAEDGTLVRIVFKDRQDFTFALLHPETAANPSKSWRSVESPGRHFTTAETYEHPQFPQAIGSVYGWTDRVAEEVLLEAKAHNDTSLIEDRKSVV